ncbi:hypothetical protein VNO78_28252 [Psophocarpus tetragonolobus]|uniref:Uncharacterized protein n=1 Tax=Psophocarpus tetragonolobus TaxID=3891 RepID=A0AAN9S1Y1_PSOTE
MRMGNGVAATTRMKHNRKALEAVTCYITSRKYMYVIFVASHMGPHCPRPLPLPLPLPIGSFLSLTHTHTNTLIIKT